MINDTSIIMNNDIRTFFRPPKSQQIAKTTLNTDDRLPDMSLPMKKLEAILGTLTPDELQICLEREKKGPNRKCVCKYIHKRLNPKSRKSCETPPEELIVALYLLFGISVSVILCDETSLTSKIKEAIDVGKLICKDNLDGYISNVISQGKKSIDYLKSCEKMNHLRQNTQQIIIAGKKQCDLIPELNAIHKSLENKAKTIKSDLYIKDLNDQFIGISVKKNGKCPDTNFSVMSFFDKEAKEGFIMAKTEMMKPIEITPFTYIKNEHRDDVNKLLLERNNPLWQFFKKNINECSPSNMGKQILECIFGTLLPYPIMKFCGSDLIEYSKEDIIEESVKFEEHEPFYSQKNNGKTRNTAKMFYILEYKGTKYRVEIRFKGNHGKGTSPQFLAYSLK